MMETKYDRSKISFKANEISIKNLPLTSQTYQTPILNQPKKRIGTSAADHNVGQLDNNVYKVKRVLEKTNFQDQIGIDDLAQGESSAILKVIHHLMFRASERFTEHI